LVSVPTAVSFFGAVIGATLARALTNLSLPVALIIGGVAGWLLSSIVFGAPAERLDRRLHRMGGGPSFRRRRD
jgi:hypothetical protein